jgi:hypothetical protein
MDQLTLMQAEREEARQYLISQVLAHRDVANDLAEVRQQISDLQATAKDLAETVSARLAARDEALRRARATGIQYRELERITGLQRARLEQVVHKRQPPARTKAADQ